MLLEFDNIIAGYGPVTVLYDVSLNISPGEIVCIIGPNGAGKSTVLKTIAGLIRPGAGAIRFQGKDITGLNIE